MISTVFFVSESFFEVGLVRDFSVSVVLVPLETFVFAAGLLSTSAAAVLKRQKHEGPLVGRKRNPPSNAHLDLAGSGPDDALLVLEPEVESPIFVRSVALVLLRTVNSVDLAAASVCWKALPRSAVALRRGNVTDIVGVSPSSSLPRSGVDVQEEDKDLPALPNLRKEIEMVVPVFRDLFGAKRDRLAHLEEEADGRESDEDEDEDDDEEEVLEPTPESVEDEEEALPSSLLREEGELHEDKLGVDMVTSSFRKDGSFSLDFPPCSL